MHGPLTGVRLVTVILSLVLVVAGAQAQMATPYSSGATSGATGGLSASPASPIFSANQNLEILRHRDYAGKPCLTVSGYARAHVINPNLYDHVITAVNSCPKQLALQVCYSQSTDCVSISIPGNSNREAILGVYPSMKEFRFEFKERF